MTTAAITRAPMQVVHNSFQSFLSADIPVLELDLHDATLVQVLSAHGSMAARRNGGKNTDASIIAWVQRLEEEYGATIMPRRVDAQFYALAVQKMVEEQDLRLSTVNLYLGKIKNALSWSKKYNGQVSTTFDDFQHLDYNNEHIALTPDEVSQIAHFRFDLYRDASGRPLRRDTIRTLSAVRDMFVLQCNLGQRFSDLHRLSPDCFDESRTRYRVIQQKTGNIAEVDIQQYAIDPHITHTILRRYNYTNPLPHMDIFRFNKLLHRIVHMIGGDFLAPVTIAMYKVRGQLRQITVPLYKEITTHTARRTFITIHANRGTPYTAIRRCSGHKSLKSFEGYICNDHIKD